MHTEYNLNKVSINRLLCLNRVLEGLFISSRDHLNHSKSYKSVHCLTRLNDTLTCSRPI